MKKICLLLSVIFLALSFEALAQSAPAASDSSAASEKPKDGASGNQSEAVDESSFRVKVKLKFYRWSFSNRITIPSLDGEVGRPVRMTKEEREALRRQEKGSVPVLWYKSGAAGSEQWTHIVMQPGKKTTTLSYEGPKEIVFCDKLPPRNDMEEAYYKPISKLVIPDGATNLYVLMFVRGSSIRFYPMNLSPDKLNKDQVAVMNMTSHPIAVDMSGKKVLLRSGAYKVSNALRKGDEVDLSIFRRDEKSWVEVYKNRIIATENERTIILVYDPYGKKKLNPNIEMLTL